MLVPFINLVHKITYTLRPTPNSKQTEQHIIEPSIWNIRKIFSIPKIYSVLEKEGFHQIIILQLEILLICSFITKNIKLFYLAKPTVYFPQFIEIRRDLTEFPQLLIQFEKTEKITPLPFSKDRHVLKF